MTFTQGQLQLFIGDPHRAGMFFPYLSIYLPKYHITDTPQRLQTFMAHTAHESMGFSALVENLNYSEEAILRVFKKYFKKPADAKSFARNPEKLGNRVYANRMGNSNESSGDGFRHRGRGLFQLTGKTMYELFGAQCFGDKNKFIVHPELLATPEYAVQSACWFWAMKNMASFADEMAKAKPEDVMHHFQNQTIRLNGGLNGYDERVEWLHKAEKIFVEPNG